MTRVRVNINGEGITNRLKLRVGRALKNANIDKIAKEEMVDGIRGANGKPTLPSGSPVRKITPGTVKNRRRLAQRNPTHPEYRPERSNLTLTGELLDRGIRSSFLVAKLLLTLAPSKGSHKLYKVKKRRKGGRRKRSRYEDIFEGQADQGRPVFTLGNNFLNKIQRRVIAEVRRILR